LMIDSKWDRQRRKFLKSVKEKNIWIKRKTWTTDII
jgi:hypothetical protein